MKRLYDKLLENRRVQSQVVEAVGYGGHETRGWGARGFGQQRRCGVGLARITDGPKEVLQTIGALDRNFVRDIVGHYCSYRPRVGELDRIWPVPLRRIMASDAKADFAASPSRGGTGNRVWRR